MRTTLTAAALIAATTLAACGSSDTDSASKFSGEQKAAAQVLEDLSQAGKDNDAKKICTKLLASTLTKQLKAAGVNCEKQLSDSIKTADNFDLTVKSVKVSGDKAVATVSSRGKSKDETSQVTLVKENGAWRISSLG